MADSPKPNQIILEDGSRAEIRVTSEGGVLEIAIVEVEQTDDQGEGAESQDVN